MKAVRVAVLALASLVPLAVLAQGASTPKGAQAIPQPGMLELVQPRIAKIRQAGITQIVGAEKKRAIQVLTQNGPAYVRWPRGTEPFTFELYFNADGTNVAYSAGYNATSKPTYAKVLDAVVTDALDAASRVRAQATRVKP